MFDVHKYILCHYLSYDRYLSTCLKIVNEAMRADTNTNANFDYI